MQRILKYSSARLLQIYLKPEYLSLRISIKESLVMNHSESLLNDSIEISDVRFDL